MSQSPGSDLAEQLAPVRPVKLVGAGRQHLGAGIEAIDIRRPLLD
jgi:hypothetical protein